ncbi:TonB-like protein [Acidisarcina polymorpha]|uniref:TonB-like protein n=1 Tax=Acidisarcina polymorpha TaxID=2211140 RepID=A0A2Z5FTR6_9BACT|nr:M56 family metallopeptidase [Acidisarcina polymorpha]AXC10203.1 TonB-like protein [Acidisarcina polymorpha]
MSSVSSLITSYLVNSVWELPFISGAGWLISLVFQKLGSRSEHATWVVTFSLAVSMPAIPPLRFLVGLATSSSFPTHSSIAFEAAQAAETPLRRALSIPTPAAYGLICSYLLVLLYFTIRLGWSIRNTQELIYDASPALLTEEQENLWRRCTQFYSLKPIKVRISERVRGPVALGFGQPVLLFPPDFLENCSSQDLLAAFAHESAHMKRHDFIKNLFYELFSLSLCFHPITWVLKSRIAQTREMVCDSMATERLLTPFDYTESLLRLATMIRTNSRAMTSHAIGIFDADILEKRVMVVKTKTWNFSPWATYALTAATMIFMGAITAWGTALAVTIEPVTQRAASPETSSAVYKVGNGVGAPTVIKSVDPQFPDGRNTKGMFQGVCIVGLVVDTSGMPKEVHIVKPLAPDFDANAIKAVQQYNFEPAKLLGKPVAVSINIEVNYQKY